MKTEITIETIAASLAISWKVAHKRNEGYAWISLQHEINGVMSFINYCAEPSHRAEARELNDDCMLLWHIAFILGCNC